MLKISITYEISFLSPVDGIENTVTKSSVEG